MIKQFCPYRFLISIMVLAVFLNLFFASCGTSKRMNSAHSGKLDTLAIAFYNVENLFDTLDSPGIKDEDFTPAGKLAWETKRYKKKLESIAKVIDAMGNPSLVGLAEVENLAVLQDLVKTEPLLNSDYGIIHADSPDERGIDVALLYKKADFVASGQKFLKMNLPKLDSLGDPSTRDVLMVKGKLKNVPITVFVNHWPSRSGGKAKTDPLREFVAAEVKKEIQSLYQENMNVLLMGDFNDEPEDRSMAEVLGATRILEPILQNGLYNCFFENKLQGSGSYNYRGNWNQLDQIIVNGKFLDKKSGCQYLDSAVFQKPWMMYTDPKFGLSPNRTYGGPNYYGGFSDHLPVQIRVLVR